MSRLRALYAIARADFLERVRRSSFLVTLGAAAWLGWLVVQGRVSLRVGQYTGAVNGAWAGGLVAATLSVLVSLAGFWVVKGSVARDRSTRVGEILAATPLSRRAYTLGKFLSNFAVLGAIVAVLAAAAPVLVLLQGERMELGTMLAPFLLIALPAMAVVAAIAVVFETIGPLAGGAGNVLWFFTWTAMLATPLAAGAQKCDVSGIMLLHQSMRATARATFTDYEDGFSLSIAVQEPSSGTFVWNGVDWTSGMVASRCAWFVVAGLIALGAAIPFDRFDASGRRGAGRGEDRAAAEDIETTRQKPVALAPAVRLTPIPAEEPSPASLLFRVYVGELRLMLRGQAFWWWAVALGLLVATFVAPLAVARGSILPFAWIWPVLVWSGMGAREALHGTGELVFSAPRPLAVQVLAVYLAGVTVALVGAAGIGLKCLATFSPGPLGGWLAGALFVPALALALGAWSGTSRLFEALYTVLWYVGPLQPTPLLDFMGASDAAVAAGMPALTGLAAAGLVAAAILGRRVRMRL